MIIDANGFKAESFTEILTRLSNGLKDIYGQDIKFDVKATLVDVEGGADAQRDRDAACLLDQRRQGG